jgi:isorenieratene synthase
MTIVEGEGKGSVVETHATPIEPGRTAIVEATLATSDRQGFRHAMKLVRIIRPFIERSARRLWKDDAAYAERLHARRGGPPARP